MPFRELGRVIGASNVRSGRRPLPRTIVEMRSAEDERIAPIAPVRPGEVALSGSIARLRNRGSGLSSSNLTGTILPIRAPSEDRTPTITPRSADRGDRIRAIPTRRADRDDRMRTILPRRADRDDRTRTIAAIRPGTAPHTRTIVPICAPRRPEARGTAGTHLPRAGSPGACETARPCSDLLSLPWGPPRSRSPS